MRSCVATTAAAAVAGAIVGAGFGTVGGFLGGLDWLLDVVSAFRVQYALILLAACMAALLLARWRMAAVAALLLLLNVAVIAPLFVPTSDQRALRSSNGTAAVESDLDLMVYNVLRVNERKEEVARYVEASGADLVFLQETDIQWRDAIEAGATGYRIVSEAPRDDNFGMLALAARHRPGLEVTDSHVLELVPEHQGLPAIELIVVWDGTETAMLATHPVPPMTPQLAALRDAQLGAAGVWSAKRDSSIVVGDLNATPWSAPFRSLQRQAGLVNSQRGFGVQPTWPQLLPNLARIPIDHLLHDDSLVTVDRRLGPSMGSDHNPLHVVLQRSAGN